MKPCAIFVFIQNRVFCADALFIRAENTVGAQSAQWPLLACDGIQDAALHMIQSVSN